ncbi:MAG TPA: LmeA family phospholipid-binding protein [Jatrophihabitantaceae bacterium]
MRTASVTVLADADRGGGTVSTTITPDRTWIVGRSPESDIVVDDSRVSRRHLVVETAGPAWVIRDVSSNGSWAAGVRIGPGGVEIPDAGEVRLHLGDSAGPELVVADRTAYNATVPIGPGPAEWATVPDAAAVHTAELPGRLDPAALPVDPAARPADAAPLPKRRRISRRRRWLIGTLIAVVVLLVVADRVAASVASTKAVQQVVERSQGLVSQPSVSFGGFPFLSQVLTGKYKDIKVGMNDLKPPEGPRIQHLSAHLKGAHIPLSKALDNNLNRIPVDHVAATVGVGFADLNAFLADQPGHVTLSSGNDGALKVSAQLTEGGTPIAVSGSGKLQVQDGQLTLTPTDLQVDGAGGLGGLINDLGDLAALFPPIPVPLPDLPFGLRLESVHGDSNGLVVSAAADHIVLDAGQQ